MDTARDDSNLRNLDFALWLAVTAVAAQVGCGDGDTTPDSGATSSGTAVSLTDADGSSTTPTSAPPQTGTTDTTGTTGDLLPTGTSSTGTTGDLSTTGTASTTTTTDGATTSTTTDTTSTTGTSTDGGTTFESTTATDEEAVCLALTDSDTAADPALWTRGHGVPGKYTAPWEVAVAPDGAVTSHLTFVGALDLGDGTVDTQGQSYHALVRYAATGEFQWSAHVVPVVFDNTYSQIVETAMAVDCAGNVVVGGSFTGRIAIQNQILTAVPGTETQDDLVFPTEDMFLVKFGPDGARHWARRFGDDDHQRIHDLVIQADGTIVVGGASRGDLDLGGEPIVSDDYVGLLAAFDPGGSLVWQRTYEAASDVAVQALSVGPDDILSAFGHAGGDTDFGGGPVVFTGDPTFVAQFEADGAHRWSARFFDDKRSPYRLGTDAARGVVFTGSSGLDHFVARYDETGQLAWNHDISPGDTHLNVHALAVDDRIVLGGSLRGSFDFGGGALTTPPDELRPFLAHYDLAGAPLTSSLHDSSWGYFTAADRGPDGELALLGRFFGTLDLGDGLLESVGEMDLFIHRAPQ
ncbi:hypothetical protein [Nannocystis punicea]|uniref:Uncharacterized protein n=1 Tax=Nannocystis punicea TaxID=2995304 RepID=A0ABY7H9B1_9BACT|nr:hypothetical protein [Nannocystis poenicansa]WAS95680.1 hypothetical protein O0S08_05915 [Nannocystis poenicansa]